MFNRLCVARETWVSPTQCAEYTPSIREAHKRKFNSLTLDLCLTALTPYLAVLDMFDELFFPNLISGKISRKKKIVLISSPPPPNFLAKCQKLS
jgi:hypothetical protein